MLPTRLGIASLRQTSKLRRNTGHQRKDRSGARQIDSALMAVSSFLPYLSSGQLQEQILQIRRAMQGAQFGMRRQLVEQRLGMLGVAEHSFATHLHACGQ